MSERFPPDCFGHTHTGDTRLTRLAAELSSTHLSPEEGGACVRRLYKMCVCRLKNQNCSEHVTSQLDKESHQRERKGRSFRVKQHRSIMLHSGSERVCACVCVCRSSSSKAACPCSKQGYLVLQWQKTKCNHMASRNNK